MLHAVGIVVMLLSAACLVSAGVAWVGALARRPRGVGLTDGNLWSRLTSEGIRSRNVGVWLFMVGAVLFAAGWALL